MAASPQPGRGFRPHANRCRDHDALPARTPVQHQVNASRRRAVIVGRGRATPPSKAPDCATRAATVSPNAPCRSIGHRDTACRLILPAHCSRISHDRPTALGRIRIRIDMSADRRHAVRVGTTQTEAHAARKPTPSSSADRRPRRAAHCGRCHRHWDCVRPCGPYRDGCGCRSGRPDLSATEIDGRDPIVAGTIRLLDRVSLPSAINTSARTTPSPSMVADKGPGSTKTQAGTRASASQ